jgi:transcriptional regulator with XRE-family HTH domain
MEFKDLRESLGYTQEEFAALLYVTRSAITRAEKIHPSRLVMANLEIAKMEGRLVPKQ